MSTVYTIDIQGTRTNLLTSNADYDYEYDAPNFKFTFQSGASESATHINPAIDQNSISTIGEECSIINGGAVSSMTSTPTVTLTGAELMTFIKANGINLVNCSIVVNATIDAVTSTLFTGKISAVEYVDSITIRLKSIEDGLSIDDIPVLTLSEDIAPGVDPSLYGAIVPVTIGNGALVRLYPIEGKSCTPSINALRTELHFEDATQQPYIFDASGNPAMQQVSVVVMATNNGSGSSPANPLELGTIISQGLFLNDATEYYNGYEIEIITGAGAGLRFGIASIDGNIIKIDRRFTESELNDLGGSSYYAPKSWPATNYQTGIVSIDRGGQSNVTSITVAGKGAREDDSDYPGSNSGISYFRFSQKSAQFYFQNPTITEAIDGYTDALTVESIWSKDVGYITNIDSEIVDSGLNLSIMQINAKREGDSILVDQRIPLSFYCVKRIGLSDQTGNEYSTSATVTLSTTGFFHPDNMPNNGTLIPFGVRTNIFDGSFLTSQVNAPYEQSIRYMVYSKVDSSLNGMDIGSLKAKLSHNLKINVTSSGFNNLVARTVRASVSIHIMGEDMVSCGCQYAQSETLFSNVGERAFEIDSINGVYTNQPCRDLGTAMNGIDVSSMISSMATTGVKYIVCFYEVKYFVDSVAVGDYITVDIASPQLTVSRPVSTTELYCTLVQPVSSPDIISASDIVRLSLLSANQTIDEASFANARASMPSAGSPSITIDDGDLSSMIANVCKWSGMSLIKDRLGVYNAKWWLNDDSGASPSRIFGHNDIAEKSGIQITKSSTGFSCSKFGFKITGSEGSTSALVVNPGVVSTFPVETAWAYGEEQFRQHTGDTRTFIGSHNGSNYYLYKSGETLPLTPRNPFIKGAVYAIRLFAGLYTYVRIIDFALSSTGKIDIIFKVEQGTFWDVIIPGNAFYLAKSQPDWKYLVSGSGVTMIDYQTARNIWNYARDARESIGKTIALPSDMADVSQNIFGSNVSMYIEQLVKHNARQKQLIDFEVKLNTANLAISLLDWVAIEAGPFVANPIAGWVINVNLNPGVGTIGLTVMAFDQDFSGNFVINENHTQGLSAPIVIDEEAPSTNIFSEA
jgi:hypothetical protein